MEASGGGGVAVAVGVEDGGRESFLPVGEVMESCSVVEEVKPWPAVEAEGEGGRGFGDLRLGAGVRRGLGISRV